MQRRRMRMASIVGRIAGVIWVKVRMFDPNVGAATRWKKGVSGNRGGRPKSRLLSELLRGRLAEVKPDDPEHRSWAETIARNFDRDRRFQSRQVPSRLQTRLVAWPKTIRRNVFKSQTSRLIYSAVPTRNLQFSEQSLALRRRTAFAQTPLGTHRNVRRAVT